MIHEVVDKWENHDDDRQCPHCGAYSEYERLEEDDGFDYVGHWIAFLFECNECGDRWWASYYLSEPKLEAIE